MFDFFGSVSICLDLGLTSSRTRVVSKPGVRSLRDIKRSRRDP